MNTNNTIPLKKKRFFYVLSLLFVCCWGERGKAECCPNQIICYADYEGNYLGLLSNPKGNPPDFFAFKDDGWGCCLPMVDAVQLCINQYPGHPSDTYYFLPQNQGAIPKCGNASPCDMPSHKKNVSPLQKNINPQTKKVPPPVKNLNPPQKNINPQIKGGNPPQKGIPPQRKS